jgi:choline-sulfatase
MPTEMDGRSLRPLLGGGQATTRQDFFLEHVDVIDVEHPIPDSRGLRSGEWKYIRYVNVQPEAEEMYQLGVDPTESRNLADRSEYVEIRRRLRERYDSYVNSLER